MKRTRYDAEYERVRQEAGVRTRPEFPEENAVETQAEASRVAVSNEEFKQRIVVLQIQDAKAAAIRQERSKAFTVGANQRALENEYHQAGVKWIHSGKDGGPTISLSLLLGIGWKIEETIGGRMLICPDGAVPTP